MDTHFYLWNKKTVPLDKLGNAPQFGISQAIYQWCNTCPDKVQKNKSTNFIIVIC